MGMIDLFTDSPRGIGAFAYITPAAGDPASGNFTLATATSLEISDTSQNGRDVGSELDALVAGNHINLYVGGEDRSYVVESVSDNGAGGWHTITVAVSPTSSTGFALNTGDEHAVSLIGGGGGITAHGDLTGLLGTGPEYNHVNDAELAAMQATPVIRSDVQANRGAAASYSGEFMYATDTRILWQSDGTDWTGTGEVRAGLIASLGAAADWKGTFYLTTDATLTLKNLLYWSDGSTWTQSRKALALIDVVTANRLVGRKSGDVTGNAEMFTPLDVSEMIAKDGVGIEHDGTVGLRLKDGGVGTAKLDMSGAAAGEIATVQAGATEWGWDPAPISALAPVRAATHPTNPAQTWSLATHFENGDVVDGVTLATGDRILIKDGLATPIGTYTYDEAVTPTADGHAKPSNADGAATITIEFFDTNAASVDNTSIFTDLRIGDWFRIGQYLAYTVSGTPVDNGGTWTVPVAFHPSTFSAWGTFTASFELGLYNGIYTVNASGAPTRSTDFGTGTAQGSAAVTVEEGTLNGDVVFLVQNDGGSDVVDTDRLEFAVPRRHVPAAGFGGFTAAGEAQSSNADNGAFHVGGANSVGGATSFGIKIAGKTHGLIPGWGYGRGSPLRIESIISQSIGAGGHIVLRRQDKPEDICVYRATQPPHVEQSPVNDDTWFKEITLLGTTFDNFDSDAKYDLTPIPQAPSCGYSGSGVIDFGAAATYGDHWTWGSQLGWQNQSWTKAAGFTLANPTTNALYDHTGILMPADGCVIQVWINGYLTDLASSTVNVKPTLTRMRGLDGASTTTNALMFNASLTNNLALTPGQMKSWYGDINRALAQELTDPFFVAGDKLLLSLMEIAKTNSPTDCRIEWGIKVIFFEPQPTGEAPGDDDPI